MIETFTCHICGKERPDALIGVQQNPQEVPGCPPGTLIHNVRYCLDNPECAEKAKTHKHGKATAPRPS